MEDQNTSNSNVLKLAKQGDPKAISFLLNRQLNPKGINARLSSKNDYLHIMFESSQPLPKGKMIALVEKLFSSISPSNFSAAKIYGRQTGEEIPDWMELVEIIKDSEESLEDLAKRGDKTAIAKILNEKLKVCNVQAKVGVKENCLQIMLEYRQAPERGSVVSQVKNLVESLQISSISEIKIFGKQIDEDFPEWNENISLNLTAKNDINTLDGEVITVITPQKTTIAREVDGIFLSNKLYISIQDICYQRLNYKVEAEENKSIRDIAQDFVIDLEADLKSDLEQLPEEIMTVYQYFGIDTKPSEFKHLISTIADRKFPKIKSTVRDLERATESILQSDFSQDSGALNNIFSGITQGITSEFTGSSLVSERKGAAMGAVLGSFVAPGLGTVGGSAVGHAFDSWLGGGQQKVLREKYDAARNALLIEWEALVQEVYESIRKYAEDAYGIQETLTYQVIEESIDRYNKGNDYLEEEEDQNALKLYQEATNINPGLALAWNNKGFVLNHLENYQEALEALDKAIYHDEKLVISFNNKGDALRNLRELELALECYDKGLALEPYNYLSLLGKANCLADLDYSEEAIKTCEKLVSLDSTDFNGWYIKAVCLARIKESNYSLENLRESVSLEPKESQKLAKLETSFDYLRNNEEFQELMESTVGVSYSNLKGLLKKQSWREADQETARLIENVVEKITGNRKVNKEALKRFPSTDLKTIDRVWEQSSEGKFGFSIQNKIYLECSKDIEKFGKKIDWFRQNDKGEFVWRNHDEFIFYFATASKGHLPSSLWAGEDGWFENSRDRLFALFERMGQSEEH